jgi:hypothetical protein
MRTMRSYNDTKVTIVPTDPNTEQGK